MTQPDPVVFLLDVDNTLLDNDAVVADLKRHLTQALGAECQKRYWAIFEERRAQLGYTDYLGALQRYRDATPHDPNFLKISSYLLNYPFADRLYPASLEVIDHLKAWGPPVILSDGDVIFQPRKVDRSGLAQAVGGRVLICIHKEHELDQVEKYFPARRYVLVDDKLRILTAVKEVWGSRVTTVFPRQGHYAHDPGVLAIDDRVRAGGAPGGQPRVKPGEFGDAPTTHPERGAGRWHQAVLLWPLPGRYPTPGGSSRAETSTVNRLGWLSREAGAGAQRDERMTDQNPIGRVRIAACKRMTT